MLCFYIFFTLYIKNPLSFSSNSIFLDSSRIFLIDKAPWSFRITKYKVPFSFKCSQAPNNISSSLSFPTLIGGFVITTSYFLVTFSYASLINTCPLKSLYLLMFLLVRCTALLLTFLCSINKISFIFIYNFNIDTIFF